MKNKVWGHVQATRRSMYKLLENMQWRWLDDHYKKKLF